jgi:hypothetical protein
MSTVNVYVKRSDGRLFYFNDDDWGIPSDGLSGIDNAGFEVFTEKRGFGDGDIVTGIRATSREVEITARTRSLSNLESLRYKAINFFNHTYTYKLYFVYMGQTRWISARLNAFSCPSENVNRPFELKAQFLCPDAYLQGTESYTEEYSDEVDDFFFPLVLLDDGNDLVSHYSGVTTKPIYYAGTSATPLTITVLFASANNGLIVNVYNAKGEHASITIDYTFTSGDYLVITPKEIVLNGSVLSPQYYINDINDLQLLYLYFGDNSINLEDQDGNQYFSAQYSWSARYMGM